MKSKKYKIIAKSLKDMENKKEEAIREFITQILLSGDVLLEEDFLDLFEVDSGSIKSDIKISYKPYAKAKALQERVEELENMISVYEED